MASCRTTKLTLGILRNSWIGVIVEGPDPSYRDNKYQLHPVVIYSETYLIIHNIPITTTCRLYPFNSSIYVHLLRQLYECILTGQQTWKYCVAAGLGVIVDGKLNKGNNKITAEQSHKGKVKTHNNINRQNQSTSGKLWKPQWPWLGTGISKEMVGWIRF
jgi:hypothetical protein